MTSQIKLYVFVFTFSFVSINSIIWTGTGMTKKMTEIQIRFGFVEINL